MKNLLIPIIVFAIGISASIAQSIAPEVIASAGNSDNDQLNWTIGEVVIDTYDNGSNILTQGFHQTNLTVVGVDETNLLDLDVNVFPNPTSDRVIISLNGNENALMAELYDMGGKLILNESIQAGEQQKELDVSALATSYYMLRLFSEDGEYAATYKIQKTNK